jgi:N,N'-diacetyllegionaminate synthase
MAADLPEEFRIGARVVGGSEPTYVIAEAGSNHDRDLAKAKALVDAAHAAGADAVKFQTYSGSRLYSRNTPQIASLAAVSDKAPTDLLEDISLPREWQGELAAHAREIGIDFFSTPFDLEAVAELDAVGVPVFKIASFEIGDLGLIRAAAGTGRPLIISTGMATLDEIAEAIDVAVAAGARGLALLQCVSLYPAPADLTNLRAMETMQERFRVPVGLSDHTTGSAVPIAAAALGAAIIEKHFTLDRSSPGPDHSFALEPDELKTLVAAIREAQSALGDGRKTGPAPEEEENFRVGRRSLVLTRDLPAGTTLEADMLSTKRPGTGIPPRELDRVLGRSLLSDAHEDDILTWEML